MREADIGALHQSQVTLNTVHRIARVRYVGDKNEQTGDVIERSHSCSCACTGRVLCPYCILTDHFQALGSLGLIGPSVPLIPTIDGAFASKAHVASSLNLVELRCGGPVDVTSNRKLSGHTFRVSGVCYWASVVGLVATAHLARHTVDTDQTVPLCMEYSAYEFRSAPHAYSDTWSVRNGLRSEVSCRPCVETVS